LFGAFEKENLNKEVGRLNQLIDKGRIPISHKNVQKIPWNKKQTPFETLVNEHSENADLVVMGFSLSKIIEEKGEFFGRFEAIKDILFVRAGQRIAISETRD
jgi:hypothetical protein